MHGGDDVEVVDDLWEGWVGAFSIVFFLAADWTASLQTTMHLPSFNSLTSTTTWSPRLTSSVGTGNWPLIKITRLGTPSGFTSPHSIVSLNLRTAGFNSLWAAAQTGE